MYTYNCPTAGRWLALYKCFPHFDFVLFWRMRFTSIKFIFPFNIVWQVVFIRKMFVHVVKLFNFKLFTLFVFFTELVLAIGKADKVSFQFPEYDYKETNKNVSKINIEATKMYFIDFFFIKLSYISRNQELSFREFESACDQSKRCENLARISRIRCVRECISPSCYRDIYEQDEVICLMFCFRQCLTFVYLHCETAWRWWNRRSTYFFQRMLYTTPRKIQKQTINLMAFTC